MKLDLKDLKAMAEYCLNTDFKGSLAHELDAFDKFYHEVGHPKVTLALIERIEEMKDRQKKSRKELESENEHCAREQEEYEKTIETMRLELHRAKAEVDSLRKATRIIEYFSEQIPETGDVRIILRRDKAVVASHLDCVEEYAELDAQEETKP